MSSEVGKVFTLSWKIKNFSSCSLKTRECLQSPLVEVEKFGNTKWRLELYPGGMNENTTDSIGLILYRYESNSKTCVKQIELNLIKIEIFNAEGRRLISRSVKNKLFFPVCGIGFLIPIKIDQLTNDMEQWKEDTLDIRCHAYVTNYDQPPIDWKTTTEIEVEKYLFDWEIAIPPSENWSKKIVNSFREKNRFDVTLKSSARKINLKIGVPKEQKLPEKCKLKISILNKENFDNNLQKKSFLLELSDFETSFEKREVCHNTNLASTTSFKLLCTILIGKGTSTSLSCSYENAPVSKHIERQTTPDDVVGAGGDELQKLTHHRTLQNDLRDMFLEEQHCDVDLRVGSETIQAHKCLLSARSPVFATMFDQEMVESQTGIVDIVDCETETLQLFLEFLYTDAITNTDCEEVLKLMLVADKYQVSVLKDKCSEILMSKISLDNVCEVISVADMVNQLDLKLSALDFIKIEKNDIFSSTIWSELVKKNNALGMEILTKISID